MHDENNQWLKTIIDWIDKRLDKHQEETDQRINEIRALLMEVLKWKWIIIGGGLVISGFVTFVFQIFLTVLQIKGAK